VRTGLPLVEVRGSPREVGRQHGRAARARIARNVALYLQRFELEGRVDRSEIRRRAEAYAEAIQDANPAYAEEMAGIAEGSRQDPLDIVAVNVRYEILYTEFARKGMERDFGVRPGVAGCSAFALLPSRTASGHLLIGQNWDWIPEVEGLLVRGTRDGHPRSLAFTEAGIAGAKIGLNAAGIGLVINGLTSDGDTWSRLGKSFHVRCWEVLASRTVDEAVRAVTGTKRACSANFLIAGAGGRVPRVVDVETAPETERVLAPAGGSLVHTNHFLDAGLLGVREPLGDDRPSTLHRFARMQALLQGFEERGARVRVDDLKAILRDHDGSPNSICRHTDPGRPPLERYETVASVIMDVDAGEMYVAAGPPCGSRYRRHALAA
jgi:isopenicillin-N N-acyltransferase-like protein